MKTIERDLRSWIVTVLCLVILILAVPLGAQEEQSERELPQGEFEDIVNVKVINVIVYVRDKKTGEPITGLTIDDFELHEDKRPVKLTNFYEVAERRRTDEPEFVDQLQEVFGAELARFAAVQAREGIWPADFELGSLWGTLRRNAEYLRGVLLPEDPANFQCRRVTGVDRDGGEVDLLEVEAWATTAIPAAVEGFRFGNGRTVPAGRVLVADDALHRRADDLVVLPQEGRRLTFRFPIDQRLARLRDVAEIKRAIRAGENPGRTVKVALEVLFRPIAARQATAECLPIRRGVDPAAGRPRWPSLLDALERHACLAYDFEYDLLALRPGVWDVDGDLVIPPGYKLDARPATTLRFAEGAVLLSGSPLQFLGEADDPVVLESQGESWAGLVVLDCKARSRLSHVVVRRAAAVDRGGWQTTGGVTFYRADFDLVDTA